MMGGSRMAAIPARMRRTLSAMDQPMDLRGIEEQAVDATFTENPPEAVLRSLISEEEDITRDTLPRYFLDNGVTTDFWKLLSSDGWGGRESYGYGKCTFGNPNQRIGDE
jgi:hypothetical protein